LIGTDNKVRRRPEPDDDEERRRVRELDRVEPMELATRCIDWNLMAPIDHTAGGSRRLVGGGTRVLGDPARILADR
jgi:hypothetical protein